MNKNNSSVNTYSVWKILEGLILSAEAVIVVFATINLATLVVRLTSPSPYILQVLVPINIIGLIVLGIGFFFLLDLRRLKKELFPVDPVFKVDDRETSKNPIAKGQDFKEVTEE